MASFSIGIQAQYSVLVSECDLEHLTKWRWTFKRSRGGLIYARRTFSVWARDLDGQRYRSHVQGLMMHVYVLRDLMGLPRPSPEHTPDHIDRDSLDNRRENLRWATPQEQEANKSWRIVGRRLPAPQPEIPF